MGKTKYIRKKNRHTSCLSRGKLEGIENYLVEYTQQTSLHGVRYLGQRRTILEKIIWLSSIIASIICSSYLVWKSYEKWDTSPVVMSVVDMQRINEITFPAVTICSAWKFTDEFMDVLQKFSKKNQGSTSKITQQENSLVLLTALWCSYGDPYQISLNSEDEFDLDMLELIVNNTPAISDLFEECRWDSYKKDCEEYFTPTLTEDGICYTFNSLNRSDMFKPEVMTFKNFNSAKMISLFEEHPDNGLGPYPYRISPRNHTGLSVILKMPKNHSSPCIEFERGHKVHIHLPNEKPWSDDNNFYIQPYESVIVDLLPELIIPHEDLRSYKPSKRNCFYYDDINLKYFKYYTHNNCLNECYSALSRFYGNCSTYYMPYPNMRICSASDKEFIDEITRVTISNNDYNSELSDHINDIDNNSDDIPTLKELPLRCKCLEACKVVRYDFKITCTNCNQRAGVHDKDDSYYDYAKIKMNFKHIEIAPFERRPLFGVVEFLVNCGGLLGLFIGFSLLSLLEIIYFVCCRPFCSMYLNRCKFWTERPEPKKISSEHIVINLE